MIRARVQPGVAVRAAGEPLRFPRWIARCGPCWAAPSRSASAPASRARCSRSTSRSCPNTAGRWSRRRPSALLHATFYVAGAGPLAGVRVAVRPARPPPGHAVRARLRRGRGDPHRPHDEPLHPRRHAPARGRVDRRQHPVDPRLHRARDRRQRAPARQGGGPLRGRDARRHRRRLRGRAAAVRRPGPDGVLPERGVLRGLVPDLPVRRRRPRSPTSGPPRGDGASPRVGLAPLRGPPPDARTSGCSPRPGSRSTRRSGCGSASRSSSSRRRTRASRTSSCCRASAPVQISLAAVVIGILFGAGLIYWGNRFKNMRRTTIILYGILGGGVLVAGGLAINHGAALPFVVPIGGLLGGRVRAVRPRRRDPGRARPPRRHLRAVPARPRRDHGPLQRLPRHRPDRRRPRSAASRPTGGASTACWSPRWRCCSSPSLPLAQLRRQEHYVGGLGAPASFDDAAPA